MENALPRQKKLLKLFVIANLHNRRDLKLQIADKPASCLSARLFGIWSSLSRVSIWILSVSKATVLNVRKFKAYRNSTASLNWPNVGLSPSNKRVFGNTKTSPEHSIIWTHSRSYQIGLDADWQLNRGPWYWLFVFFREPTDSPTMNSKIEGQKLSDSTIEKVLPH